MKKTAETQSSALSFEAALSRLEEITAALSGGEASLETALELYAEGARLAAACQKKLSDAEQTVETPREGGEGDKNNEL